MVVFYLSAEDALAEVEIDESRNNSEEGVQRYRYRVRYKLLDLAGDWLISEMEIIDP